MLKDEMINAIRSKAGLLSGAIVSTINYYNIGQVVRVIVEGNVFKIYFNDHYGQARDLAVEAYVAGRVIKVHRFGDREGQRTVDLAGKPIKV